MKPTLRNYQNENDYWRIREFLREVSMLNDRHDYSWSLLRWDYWVWHVNTNIFHMNLKEVVYLWEVDGQIVAVLNPDHDDESFFQIHPSYHRKELLCEMLEVAELRLPKQKNAGKKELTVWVNEGDGIHKQVLTDYGYARSKFSAEHMRRRSLTQPIPFDPSQGKPDSVPHKGYTIRALGEEDELPARSWLSWKVFHPDEPDEKYEGWEWYKNIQRIPLYRRDLDLVAVAPDGELAAFCTVWVD
ncbi:MAG TPA: hypothetical protein VK880_02840, partial [Anaerolineales bacterium]|nr:hypothetical protein [Anaerolineales bacterium]